MTLAAKNHDRNNTMNTVQGSVLIVEDDPDILQLLQTTLTFNGYRVWTARNGREGLEAVQKEQPDLVIADIMMPKMDGFGLINRLRISPGTREVPIVVITATYVSPEDREFAQNIGATRFIQKPIDLEKFLGTIRELLERGAPRAHGAPEPLKDYAFYEAYAKRLEAKLHQKQVQIAREELLLKNAPSGEERREIQVSLNRAINDREELIRLLAQIHEQLQQY